MDDIRRYYNNRFILFYALRWYWKKYKHPISELHKTLFDSKGTGTNRSLFDRVLRDPHLDMTDRAARLEEITGIDKKYFIGEQVIPCNGFNLDEWDKYIGLRIRERGQEKSLELSALEMELDRQLTVAMKESNQTNDFNKLIYFASHKRREPKKSIANSIQEIEFLMEQLNYNMLASADVSVLERYKSILYKHYERIDALCVLSNWKKSENDRG